MENDHDDFGLWQDETAPLSRAGIALCCLSACLVLVALLAAFN